ncbi:hypothetical protein RNO70_23780, partial [Escherichia coli]|nr:hypothetical protein [Escherichia coli]
TDGDGSHGSTSKTPSYTKSVSWHHYRREVKQYLAGKQIGARTAIAVLCRQEMVVLKQRMPGSR